MHLGNSYAGVTLGKMHSAYIQPVGGCKPSAFCLGLGKHISKGEINISRQKNELHGAELELNFASSVN